jgi:nucleoside-diphosphate-sugar epimerase
LATRVLVTGGAGYIGSILTEKLLAQGYAVRVLDRLYWGREPLGDALEKVELIHGDIRGLKDDWLDGIDAVIHLAGLSNDPTAEYDPEANWQMNALATEQLAKACKRRGIERFTFGSSCSVYDGLPPGTDYAEHHELNPKGAYAEAKYYAEGKLEELADERFCPVILRQGTVFGFSPRMRYDLVVNTFVKDALQKGQLKLHGGGWMWRPLVDVTDTAQAHIVCLEAPADKVRGEVFNVVQNNYLIRELAMMVAGTLRIDNRDVQLEEVPAPPRTRDYRCTNEKMSRITGFTPQTTVLQSISHMLESINRNGYTQFDHPRYYNIAWMELLSEVHSSLRPFDHVLREGK